ncbi:transposase [Rhodospirillaceae bacterium LM-1]|nr:transposase [Rhodospirillaceae bacterium LM-1]
MARPLRIEYPGALYHVTARGNARQPIFLSKADAQAFLDTLGDTALRLGWRFHAYCLMTNHYHLLVETEHANLSRGMRHLNGVYTQAFNRAHKRVGHLFQGRYKAILVEAEAYFLELARYIVLNPVRAGMAVEPKEWLWSSYRATLGEAQAYEWFDAKPLLMRFDANQDKARSAYAGFVAEGVGKPSPWESVRNQLFLGSQAFADKFLGKDGRPKRVSPQVPKRQRQALAPSLKRISKEAADRDQAIRTAWATGAYTQGQIGAHFGLGASMVSRIVKAGRQAS